MKTITITLAALVGLASAASAQTLRNSDGSVREHDGREAFQLVDGVRVVSTMLEPGTACEAATWPDIPTSCLERVQPEQQAEIQPREPEDAPSVALAPSAPDAPQRISIVLAPASFAD